MRCEVVVLSSLLSRSGGSRCQWVEEEDTILRYLRRIAFQGLRCSKARCGSFLLPGQREESQALVRGGQSSLLAVGHLGQDLAGARQGRPSPHATPHSPGPRSPHPTVPHFHEPPSPPSPALHMPQPARGAHPTPLPALLTPLQPYAVPHTVLVTRWSMQGQAQDWGLALLPRVS